MKDTKNLKRKIKHYPKMIADYRAQGDYYAANFWTEKLYEIKSYVTERNANRRKNDKQYRKAN